MHQKKLKKRRKEENGKMKTSDKIFWIAIIPLYIGCGFIILNSKPKPCTLQYTYKIGEISDMWADEYDEHKLHLFIWEAKRKWEIELDKKIFIYYGKSENTINFVDFIDNNNATGQISRSVYDNGVPGNDFDIEVHSKIINNDHSIRDKEYMLIDVIAHELGHQIGLNHSNIKYADMMSPYPMWGRIPELTLNDKIMLFNWCNK